MPDELNSVLHVIELINIAQTSKEGPVEGPEYGAANNAKAEKKEDELPFGWYAKNEAFIRPRDSQYCLMNLL